MKTIDAGRECQSETHHLDVKVSSCALLYQLVKMVPAKYPILTVASNTIRSKI